MTDQEFKRLNRAQLIDIIYQFQLQVDQLTAQNQELERQLEDKRLRLSSAGNIADAALEINECFHTAQKAAEQYLNEIQTIREETAAERQRILSEAQAQAEAIVESARKAQMNYNTTVDAILREVEQRRSNGR